MNLPSPKEIIDDFEFLEDWESRYQYIIDLSKELPKIPEQERLDELKVKGCQSDVWLIVNEANQNQAEHGKLVFKVDSDAVIVRGLLALVMAAYNNKTPTEIVDFDVDFFFKKIDLERHLSPTRGNGLRAIVQKIKTIGQHYLD